MFVHRAIGYTVISLVAVSIMGTLIVARHCFGGDIATQAGIFTLAFMTDTAMFLAWWNIKKLQIDQHRKWMIRAMVWMSQIITLRVVQVISMIIVSLIGGQTAVCHFSLIKMVGSIKGRYISIADVDMRRSDVRCAERDDIIRRFPAVSPSRPRHRHRRTHGL
jgi:hypothetical protein